VRLERRHAQRPDPPDAPAASPARSPSPAASPAATLVAAEPFDSGELQLGVSPWVDVYVNDVKIGRAPDQSRYRLRAGTHALRVVHPSCPPVKQPLVIRAGETTRLRLTIPCP